MSTKRTTSSTNPPRYTERDLYANAVLAIIGLIAAAAVLSALGSW